jgi:hypothetical protein
MFSRTILVLAAVLMTAATATAQHQPMTDADAIRHVMKSTWDKPAEPIAVPNVVVASDHAIAGWTQGDMGGRALLRKKANAWSIILCAGDQLKDAETLRKAGIADAVAQRLSADLARSEQTLPPKDVAMFSRFEGLVTMDPSTRRAHGH